MSEVQLVLVRHAKTEQQGPPAEGDHGRRLTTRGVSDARAAGRWLHEEGLVPHLVLCSTAMRAEQTWQAMAGAVEDAGGPARASVEVWRERRVYNASPADLLAVLAQVPDAVRCLTVVGHAPGVPALVADLSDAESSEPEALATLDRGYPTMTCAVLRAGASADRLALGSMRLSAVRTPRADD